ncbi:MAG: hypothetical protein LBG58_16180 [Planctomycetaceae bacterium]|nr:hypothetical protein [Planctomycetaceae bacterium]
MVKNKLQSPKNSTDILQTLIPYRYNAKPTARLETSRWDVKNCTEILPKIKIDSYISTR